jgi:iron complex transport system permease protein
MLCLCSVLIGSRHVSTTQVVQALFDPASSGTAVEAIRLRLPRTVLGVLLGVALSSAGALMQAVTRNPLADPTILGLNAGASCAIVVSMAFFGLVSPLQYVWVALVGGSIGAAIVWWVGSMGKAGPTPFKLTLAGAVVGSMFSSITTAILLPRIDVISSYRFWAVGGLSGARFSTMLPILPLFIVGIVLAAACAPSLNALSLGDELAVSLGGSVTTIRLVAWTAAVVLCAASVSLAGPIGFVGLVIPHAARLIVGSDFRKILAVGALFGPVLLLGADVLGRLLTRPADVEVGIVTALIGAPAFVALVRSGLTRRSTL